MGEEIWIPTADSREMENKLYLINKPWGFRFLLEPLKVQQ